MSARSDYTLQPVIPQGGLFSGKSWLSSPQPFPLSAIQVQEIERMGHRLKVFLTAANSLYHRSVKGKLPAWIAAYADAGKPAELLELGRRSAVREQLPEVIRPDLILTEDGFSLTEIDSVPGGIGLTGWLNQTYAQWPIIGGARGMVDGFASLFPTGADILISEEAGDYRPEMNWLCEQLGTNFRVETAEQYVPSERAMYRFFELFDLPNIRHWKSMAEGAAKISAPFKPWLEEKLWLALFWSRPLRELWRQELRENHRDALAKLIPRSWIIDPAPLPHHAVIPSLEIHGWDELGSFTQKERELVLKLSGFSEKAWGSRSVVIGHDVSQSDWRSALQVAQDSFTKNPYVLQAFHKGKLVRHPFYDRTTGEVREMEGRVRLCPYFFAPSGSKEITLGGILATICPADKKIIHGMEDAIIVPCALSEEP
jgi:hypothetical protein